MVRNASRRAFGSIGTLAVLQTIGAPGTTVDILLDQKDDFGED